jgi:cell wall assembly regulator SMI1
VQKFTRPLTREIEVGGERLALTFSDQGIAVRPVGSRRPPWEISWDTLVCHLTGAGQASPAPDDLAAAVGKLKGGGPSRPNPTPAPAAEKTSSAAPAPDKPPARDLTALLGRLDAWLSRHRSGYHKELLPGASAANLEALQAAVGAPVPDELKTILTWHNGQSTDFAGKFEGDWALMSAGQIADAKRELDGGEAVQSGWQAAWIPFLGDDSDDYVCLDTSQPGNPVRAFWQGKTEHGVVAPSLAAWLEDFVAALVRGEYHEDPERGSFLRTEG